ncbi:MAG: SET domain-containing protein [Bacteroidota bacterium]
MSQRIPHLYVAPSPLGGRGVFTAKRIPKGSIIEVCPVLVLPPGQLPHIDQTELFNYYFEWAENSKSGALALGYGSLYNHSYAPNAHYRADMVMDTIDFYALRAIPAGNEIFVNYNGTPKDDAPLWFEPTLVAKKKAKQ